MRLFPFLFTHNKKCIHREGEAIEETVVTSMWDDGCGIHETWGKRKVTRCSKCNEILKTKMEERKLNFNRNDNPTIVVDQNGKMAEKLGKTYQEMMSNLGFCYEQLTKGELTEGMKATHLSLAESYLLSFLETFGYKGILEKQKEERHSEIRSLNDENRSLRKQLGEKVTNEDIREGVKLMYERVYKWWEKEGFGYMPKFEIGRYAATITFSGNIFDRGEAKVEERCMLFKNYGFDVDEKEHHVLMSDKSVCCLNKLITTKFPSADIDEIKVTNYSSMAIREFVVRVRNLNEL